LNISRAQVVLGDPDAVGDDFSTSSPEASARQLPNRPVSSCPRSCWAAAPCGLGARGELPAPGIGTSERARASGPCGWSPVSPWRDSRPELQARPDRGDAELVLVSLMLATAGSRLTGN